MKNQNAPKNPNPEVEDEVPEESARSMTLGKTDEKLAIEKDDGVSYSSNRESGRKALEGVTLFPEQPTGDSSKRYEHLNVRESMDAIQKGEIDVLHLAPAYHSLVSEAEVSLSQGVAMVPITARALPKPTTESSISPYTESQPALVEEQAARKRNPGKIPRTKQTASKSINVEQLTPSDISVTPKLRSVLAQDSIKEETESIEAKSEAYQSIKNKNLGDQTTESEDPPKSEMNKPRQVTVVMEQEKPNRGQQPIARRSKGQRNFSSNHGGSHRPKPSTKKSSAANSSRMAKATESFRTIDLSQEEKERLQATVVKLQD